MKLCTELENNMIQLIILLLFGTIQISGISVSSMENTIISAGASKDILDEQLWKNFKREYTKTYQSENEKERNEIFMRNLKAIRHHNTLNNSTYEFGINQFSDMSYKELLEYSYIDSIEFNMHVNYDDFELPEAVAYTEDSFNKTPPEHFDWRDHGLNMPIRDQGACGSCYVFACLEVLESTIFIKTGKFFEFSRQEIVDCASKHGTRGCKGGILHGVYSYINKRGGISLQKDYPYITNDSQCDENIPRVKFQIEKIVDFEVEDENILKKALYNEGPLIIVIDTLNESFYRYSSGVYYEENCYENDEPATHSAVLIGYGSENGNDFWIVKNSFGEKWGESGYMRVARNKQNHCKIASFNMIPIIDEKQFV